ncbi:MAG TPA: hypothetical protein VME67_19470 [Mycobacterium sp.]|nr:hypothetical protein [Mycobacterium sp.]HTX96837.1 hypothetical protein [Mycobacterium sp.]
MRGFHREFLKDAAQLGFVFDGYSGRNHIRLINLETGQQASAALTPSNRGLRNDLAKLERLSGRQLPHRQAGKY